MTKYVYFFLLSLSVTANLFSQETNIATQFSQDGTLYKNFNDFSEVLTQFTTHETCIVIDYLGKDIYKVKYKDWVGFVDSQYLVINEAMTDLFYDYQEKESNKTMEAEKIRKEVVQKIVRENEEVERQLDLQELARKAEVLKIETKRQDSIAQIKIDAAKKLESKVIITKREPEVKQVESTPINDTLVTCEYALNEFDAIDRIKIVRTNPKMLTKNVSVELFKRGKNNYVFFNLFEDLGCVSYLPGNRSYVKVTLENQLTITFYHTWDMDCGDFSFKPQFDIRI